MRNGKFTSCGLRLVPRLSGVLGTRPDAGVLTRHLMLQKENSSLSDFSQES